MPIRVLVADDHRLMRDGLKAMFKQTPDIVAVGEAASGYEALRACMRLKPDVVLMDVAMPDLNGIEATRLILERVSAPRILLLSMYADPAFVRKGRSAGARGYIAKERAAVDVLAGIRAVHEGREYYSAGLDPREAPRPG